MYYRFINSTRLLRSTWVSIIALFVFTHPKVRETAHPRRKAHHKLWSL